MGLLSALAVIAAFLVQGAIDIGWASLNTVHTLGALLLICALAILIDILFVRGGWEPLAPRRRARVGERVD